MNLYELGFSLQNKRATEIVKMRSNSQYIMYKNNDKQRTFIYCLE
jgi:hypothetical protein